MLNANGFFMQVIHYVIFAFSIYYYVQSSSNINLGCLIIVGLITILVILLTLSQWSHKILGTIICIHVDLICLILVNQANLGVVSYTQLIITQFLSNTFFQELHQSIIQQIYRIMIISVSVFLVIYTNIQIDFKSDQLQLIICLLISLWQNLGIDVSTIQSQQSINLPTVENNNSNKHDVFMTNRKMSQCDLEKNFGLNFQNSEHKNTEIDNVLTIDTMKHCFHYLSEGLLILDRNGENNVFPYAIKYMNQAVKGILGKDTEHEILDIIKGFSTCQLQNNDITDDILLVSQIQRKVSQCFFKQPHELKDVMLTSIRNPYQETIQQNSLGEKGSKVEIKDILEKVQNFTSQECCVIQVQLNSKNLITNQLIATSQSLVGSGHSENTSLLELTLSQTLDKNLIIVCRDVSHRQKIRYLREYDKQKSKMLSFVSHEYRSPLNCIIQMIERVMSFNIIKDNFDINEQLQAALDNSNYILNLSNDLLDLAQIKNGKFRIQKVPFNLQTLIQDCMRMFELKSKIQDVQLICNYNPLLPKVLLSDRNRIKQILINLLSNAFKFTTKGKIEILLIRLGSERLRIGVKDEGIGISEEDQQKLFKVFSKVNSEESKKLNQQGVGLGLVISNQIAQTIGSSGLYIESKNDPDNHYSYFYFDVTLETVYKKKISSFKIPEIIPQQQDVDEITEFMQIGAKSYEMSTFQTCLHYLIVDDDCFNIFAFKKIFEEIQKNNKSLLLKEFDVDSVLSGKECLEKIQKKKCSNQCQGYRIIFMDIEMPIMNGHYTSKLVLHQNPDQTIVGCSGYADSGERQECIKGGMVDLLVKPINEAQLIQILKKYY